MPRLVLLSLPILLAACRTPPPEGTYPCTTAGDCFTGWVCRADMRCWSTPLPVDGGTDASSGDAAVEGDTGIDAAMADAGCPGLTESCNGRDDDCDGLVDEQLLTVGAAVVASSEPAMGLGALLAPTATGFEVIASGQFGTTGGWIAIGADGTPASSFVASPSAQLALDAVGTPSGVVFSSIGDVGEVLVIDPASPSAPRSRYVIDHGPTLAVPRLASSDGVRATVYAVENDGVGGVTLWRIRVNVTTASGVLVGEQVLSADIASGVLGLAHTAELDYLVYVSTTGDLVLAAAPADDRAGSFRAIGSIVPSSSQTTGIALAIRDATSPVSATNPMAIAWTDRDAGHFTQLTDPSLLTVDTVRALPGANGTGQALLDARFVSIAPFEPSSGAPPHWVVAMSSRENMDNAMVVSRVWEVGPSGIRAMTVPGESPVFRNQLALARSSGVVRLAELANAGGIVTRSIGCE